jgi:hypothetical protein
MSSKITKIYVLESLDAKEKRTGTELFQEIIERYRIYYKSQILTEFKSISSAEELQGYLENLSDVLNEEDEVIVHIEAHGNRNELSLVNKDRVPWALLADWFRNLNKKTSHGLHVHISACNSMYLGQSIDYHKIAPFKSWTASLTEILPQQLGEENEVLYEALMRTGDFMVAAEILEKMDVDHILKTKDVEYATSLILEHQFAYFQSNYLLLKMQFDDILGINIDLAQLTGMGSAAQRAKYILELFMPTFIPN